LLLCLCSLLLYLLLTVLLAGLLLASGFGGNLLIPELHLRRLLGCFLLSCQLLDITFNVNRFSLAPLIALPLSLNLPSRASLLPCSQRLAVCHGLCRFISCFCLSLRCLCLQFFRWQLLSGFRSRFKQQALLSQLRVNSAIRLL
jgi:hypothetical protein